jgi:hypothetical protein
MTGRLDPPHDRVMLTLDEVRAIKELERRMAKLDGACEVDASPEAPKRAGVRYRMLLLCVRWVRFAPWLVPLGVVVMLATMSSSIMVSALGALLAGAGVAASAHRVWLRVGRSIGRRRLWRV